MPFTFSHPAAILPFNYLRKTYVSFTALAVGSLIPDFEYFIRVSDISRYSHTWAGIFWFDLPLAVILCFLFHNIIRDKLIMNLPRIVLTRCIHCFHFDWNKRFRKKWLIIILCILIGTTTHLVWDRLTHRANNKIEQTSVIQESELPDKDIVVYYSYWGLNSLVGIILLTISFWKIPCYKMSAHHRVNKKYWWSMLLTMLVILLFRFSIKPEHNLVNIVDSLIAALFMALVFVSLVIKNNLQGSNDRHNFFASLEGSINDLQLRNRIDQNASEKK